MLRPDLYELAVMILAAGRISYSIPEDEIWRPIRDWIWERSAPDQATNRDGEPWRMIHRWRNNKREREYHGWGKWSVEFDANQSPRKPGFFGQLSECRYCVSFWVSLAVFIAWLAFGVAIIPVLSIFALWSIVNIVAVKLL